jgi:D-threo-aldose 1-dehydrogenase
MSGEADAGVAGGGVAGGGVARGGRAGDGAPGGTAAGSATAPGATAPGAAAGGSPGGGAALDSVPLGRTGLRVTRFVLGCAPLAGLFAPVSEEEAQATLEEAWRLGVRGFDTAPHYGAGLSECRVGAFLAGKPHDYVLSTKVGRLLVEDPDGTAPPEFSSESGVRRVLDYSGDGARRSLEESLERLGIDRVDVALVHDPDDHLDEALDGAFPALAQLRAEGVVGAIGAGMNNSEPLLRIVEEADVDCVLVAGRYNLLDQEAARELVPRCSEKGVAVLAAGVLGSEVLADPRPGAHYRYEPASEEVLERARRIRDVCQRHEVPIAAAALHFPLRNPGVTAVVVGARRPAEVADDLAYLAMPVPDSLYAELEDLGLIETA